MQLVVLLKLIINSILLGTYSIEFILSKLTMSLNLDACFDLVMQLVNQAGEVNIAT